MSPARTPKEAWSSRLGVILAVAGSSVGLGNFLRFPGLAAQYGGGAFMIAYAVSFLLLGLPCGWMEWTLGRAMGERGFNSAPAMFAFFTRRPCARYLGVIGLLVPVVIFFYYIVIEGWCLGYAWNFATRSLAFADTASSRAYFEAFSGQSADGASFAFSVHRALPWVAGAFVLNFWLIYRGLARGIELACKWGLPALIILALVILARVLTLGAPDPSRPDQSVANGLGFMWNPVKVVVERNEKDRWVEERTLVGDRMIARAAETARTGATHRVRQLPVLAQLARPDLWLAAAGQVFFSLGVGFGILFVYSSYLGRRDDVILSNLTSSAANEFCEVALGGLITLPAGVALLGIDGVAGQGTFGLGFNVLPLVFQRMPLGFVFGALFFFMLFLAALTSSIAMLQGGIAFLEESLGAGRRTSVSLLGFTCAAGTGFVAWFSGGGLKALDTLDFWIGTCLIFVLATLQTLLFCVSWKFDAAWKSMHRGALLRLPRWTRPVFRWVAPAFLLAISALWLLIEVLGLNPGGPGAGTNRHLHDLFGAPDRVAWLSLALAGAFALFTALLVARTRAYRNLPAPEGARPRP